MVNSIVTALLPTIEALGLWWINNYFTDAANKQKALDAFNAFINAHKQDGDISANESENYDQQVTDLGTDGEKK